MKHQVSKAMALCLIYNGINISQFQYDLGSSYAINLVSFYGDKQRTCRIVNDILNHWDCFNEKGDVSLSKLPHPVLMRPCTDLMKLYLDNNQSPMMKCHPMFLHIDDTPSSNTNMIFTYRIAYDLLWANKLMHIVDDDSTLTYVSREAADKFEDGTTLFQLDDALLQFLP